VNPPLCIVVKGFPRVSETFITRELEALQDEGVQFTLASLRRPQPESKTVTHRVTSSIRYLPEYLHDEPMRLGRSIRAAWRMPGFSSAWRTFRSDLTRDLSRNRVRRFGQACVLAAELPPETLHLHAHFIHTPASVARYAAAIRKITFSVSAHAKDIWTTPDWDLADKLREAEFTCTCNAAGAVRLNGLASGQQVSLWPHLTVDVTPKKPATPGAPIRLLTVARAVQKKGLALLLDALARLPSEPAWIWTHIGGGPELTALKSSAQYHPYKERLNFQGSRAHAEVLEALGRHDIFILSAQVAEGGDRDGRPNALIEAMGAGLACIATGIGGIPELLTPGTGIVVAPETTEISNAISALLLSPAKIAEIGDAARIRAQDLRRDGQNGFDQLKEALRKASGQ
jgi:glycosyltransferase involved in cell wall biosynthesis